LHGQYCAMHTLECMVCPVVKETQFFIPLFQSRYLFLLTKIGLIQNYLFFPQVKHLQALSSQKSGYVWTV